MRKLVIMAILSVAFSADLGAAENELGDDLMQNIEDTNKSLSSNIALQRVDASKSDATDLEAMFEIVEAHFVKKPDAANAVDLSKKSKELAASIIQLVDAKNFDQATNSATELSRACKSCHTFYKKE